MYFHQTKHYQPCKKMGHKTVYETVWNIGICTENNEVQVAKFLDQMYKFRPSVEQELRFSKEILLLINWATQIHEHF